LLELTLKYSGVYSEARIPATKYDRRKGDFLVVYHSYVAYYIIGKEVSKAVNNVVAAEGE